MARDLQKKKEVSKLKILKSAAQLFLEQGYQKTTMTDICKNAEIDRNQVFYIFGDKESVLAELVGFVFERQFDEASKMLAGKTDDPILFYAAETTLQLYMAESSEQMREMYTTSYSLPKPSEVVYQTITGKLERIFKQHLPHLETKDFYELEIASGGIMRGYLSVPCDMYFTMDRKVKRFLETTFLVYRVSDEKIEDCIRFVSQFDYEKIAKTTVNSLSEYFEKSIK